MCPAVLRASWPGAALSDPGLENALWPQQTNLSPAEQERQPPQPQINQHQGRVARLWMISRAAPLMISSTGCEQMSGKIQNRSSLDGSFLQPSPVCSSGHCQCLWESISNPFFKHSSQGDSLLEFPSVSCVLLVASPLISQQLDGMGRERENLDMEGQNV